MRLLATFIVTLFLATPAVAQNLKSSAPQELAERIRSLGYKAELQTDKSGDPVIISATDGSEFQVYFYGCEKAKDCEWIVFHKGYSLKKTEYAKIRQLVDEWNLGVNFSKASIDDDALYLSYNLLMNNEGVGPKIFNFATWLQEYVEFRKKLAESYK